MAWTEEQKALIGKRVKAAWKRRKALKNKPTYAEKVISKEVKRTYKVAKQAKITIWNIDGGQMIFIPSSIQVEQK